MEWLDSHLVIVPNVPAWTCDVCGEVMIDTDIITRLDLLLGIEPSLDDDSGPPAPGAERDLSYYRLHRRRSV
jgi:hypothetical protein